MLADTFFGVFDIVLIDSERNNFLGHFEDGTMFLPHSHFGKLDTTSKILFPFNEPESQLANAPEFRWEHLQSYMLEDRLSVSNNSVVSLLSISRYANTVRGLQSR